VPPPTCASLARVGLLLTSFALVTTSAACHESPCVEGADDRDRLHVRLLAPYERGGPFTYSAGSFPHREPAWPEIQLPPCGAVDALDSLVTTEPEPTYGHLVVELQRGHNTDYPNCDQYAGDLKTEVGVAFGEFTPKGPPYGVPRVAGGQYALADCEGTWAFALYLTNNEPFGAAHEGEEPPIVFARYWTVPDAAACSVPSSDGTEGLVCADGWAAEIVDVEHR